MNKNQTIILEASQLASHWPGLPQAGLSAEDRGRGIEAAEREGEEVPGFGFRMVWTNLTKSVLFYRPRVQNLKPLNCFSSPSQLI